MFGEERGTGGEGGELTAPAGSREAARWRSVTTGEEAVGEACAGVGEGGGRRGRPAAAGARAWGRRRGGGDPQRWRGGGGGVRAAVETGTGSCIRNRERCRPSLPWQGAGGRAWTMAAAPLLEL